MWDSGHSVLKEESPYRARKGEGMGTEIIILA